MTGPDSKFEEEIRRALCAASDLVVPAGDGLNKIRERAARRPHILGWLLAYATHLPHQLAHGTRVAASEVAATSRGYSSLGPMLRSARRWPGGALHVLRSPDKWLRPVLASAAALFIVIGAMLAVPRLRETVATLSGFSGGSSQGSPRGHHRGAAAGGAQSNSATVIISGTSSPTSGMPYLATLLPATARCGGHGASETSGTSGGKMYPPPSLGPGPGQTVGPGVLGTETTAPLGAAGLKVAGLGAVGPQPASTCSPSTSPTHRATAPPTPPPTSAPPTPPPTSTPPTSPPPTSTPPTSTPPTSTPPTSPPPTQGTPGGSNSATADSPAS